MSAADAEILAPLEDQIAAAGVEWETPSRVPSGTPPFFYDGRAYYYCDNAGHYHPMDEKSLRRRLLDKNYYVLTEKGGQDVSPFITAVQDEHAVVYAGALSGFAAGIHKLSGGRKILVVETSSPVQPAPGSWPLLHGIIESMLRLAEIDQRPYFYAWLQVFGQSFFASLANGMAASLVPGQALVLAGPRNSGKTLLKSLVKDMFGGHSAHPHQYMLGQSTFNAELAEAPILEIDDQAASKDPRDRNHFAAKIKEFTVAGTIRVHPKYQKPIDLRPCARLVICVNDDPAALLVLPPLDPAVEDKLMMLKVCSAVIPMPTNTSSDRQAFSHKLREELPAFMHFALREFVIPPELVCGRFGVRHFHHSDIVAALEDFSPETRAIEMIDQLFEENNFSVGGANASPQNVDLGEYEALRAAEQISEPRRIPWTGPASKFEEVIRSRFERWDSERLFRYMNSAGMLLRNISAKHPNRVEEDSIIRGSRHWTINPPEHLRRRRPSPASGQVVEAVVEESDPARL